MLCSVLCCVLYCVVLCCVNSYKEEGSTMGDVGKTRKIVLCCVVLSGPQPKNLDPKSLFQQPIDVPCDTVVSRTRLKKKHLALPRLIVN